MHSLEVVEFYVVYSLLIEKFYPFSSYIMVIVSNTQSDGQEWGKGVHKAATLLNISKARSHFEQFIPRS